MILQNSTRPSGHTRNGGTGRRELSRSTVTAIFVAAWALAFTLATWALSSTTHAQRSGAGDLAFNAEDLDFILKQIEFAERHAAGEELLDILPNASVPWGLRTVDGSFNNLIEGQTAFGQADQEFPKAVTRVFSDAQNGTSYAQGDGTTVTDSTPRLISHLIVNQSVDNPAAVFAAAENGDGSNSGPDITGVDQLLIPNVAPDEGLSAPFNAFMTFFGQFFDHGLDLINKGGNGMVFMPLQQDDPLYDPGPDGIAGNEDDGRTNFMLMTRASRDAGPDGIIGTNDDVSDPVNATTPHVDQQQTYASHASVQVLLRDYEVRGDRLQNTGRLLNGYGNDRLLDTADDGGMGTWDTVQAQALEKFGIVLDDMDGSNVPMIAADLYGNFVPGPERGLPQLVTADGLVEGDLESPVDASTALRVNQSFFLDVAHTANPDGRSPDANDVINPRTDSLSGQTVRGIRAAGEPGTYDDELLGVHFTCGDGRCNENIALTTIHSIFHREHNRLADVTKRVLLDAGDLETLNEWLDTPLAAFPAWSGLPFLVSDASLANQAQAKAALENLDLDWNGQRLFQAARFGTEMQYNRIVFDEFSPTLAGLKDVFEGFHTDVDPSIGLEFSQSVYRFGHSMLTSTVDRYDADFNTIVERVTGDGSQLGLFEAFLNPLALYNADEGGQATLNPEEATGSVIRGITRTRANEIDEFVDGSLQNNLVGLPLDLGAINIARARDVGNPRLNDARRAFFKATHDYRLKPYAHWVDYADNLRHEPSLVNFVAAYGTHPSLAGPDGIIGNADDPNQTFAARRAAACAIVGALTPDPAAYCIGHGFASTPAPTPADAEAFLFSRDAWANTADGRTITGLDDIDFWNGGLAEERMPFGGYLGSTHNFVFETQLESLQNGDRFYYVGRTANLNLFSELESNSFTALVMRNTDLGEEGAGAMSLNLFSVPNHILETDQGQQFAADGNPGTADPVGESELIPLVIRDDAGLTTNIRVLDPTRVVQYTGGDHVTIGGTTGRDTIIGGIGDDTLWGRSGDDRIEGGDGADLIEGGSGDDIITDLSGPDVIEGGDGNDAISSGNEEDVIFGDAGNDFIVNPSELGEIFAGEGDDYIFDGVHLGHIRGGGGNDWIENLGGGEDLFQADHGVAAETGESPTKGHDVAIAHGGNNDFDMESGDDIIVDGPGIDRAEGQLGFDWMSFANDRFGVNIDLGLTIFLRPELPPSNNTIANRYDRIEGVSGSPLPDILRGTNTLPGSDPGNELINFDLIEGLDELVPLSERGVLSPDPVTGEPQFGWDGGDILLGGGGSDLLVGNPGDDIIDGDASLKVAILTPDPAVRIGAVGQALAEAQAVAARATAQANADATAARASVAAHAAAREWVAAAADAAAAAATAASFADAAADAVAGARSNPSPHIVVLDPSLQQSGLALRDQPQDVLNSQPRRFSQPRTAGRSRLAAQLEDRCDLAVNALELEMGSDGPAGSAASQAAATAAVATAAHTLTDAQSAAAAAEQAQARASASAAAASVAQRNLVMATAALHEVDERILVPGMQDLMEAVFGGFINPGELEIHRMISDDDPTNSDTDIAVFAGNRADYIITAGPGDYTEVLDFVGTGGRDLVRNVERLQFADETIVLTALNNLGQGNSVAEGRATILGTPQATMTLTASIAGVTDADNPGGLVDSLVDWTWESEIEPGEGFEPIVRLGGFDGNGDLVGITGASFMLTAEEAGLRVRVTGIFLDEEGVFETVTSDPILIAALGAGICGDGELNTGEECDDGGNVNGDGCSAVCTDEATPVCGDGNIDLGEQCDDGNNASGDGCSAGCFIELPDPVCGDGNVDAGEQCDDGNSLNDDGCSATCEIEVDPASLIIDRASFRRGTLIVSGRSEPVGASLTLFAPGSQVGTTCSGTIAGSGSPGASSFSFVVPRASDPGTVCIESSAGIAEEANTAR